MSAGVTRPDCHTRGIAYEFFLSLRQHVRAYKGLNKKKIAALKYIALQATLFRHRKECNNASWAPAARSAQSRSVIEIYHQVGLCLLFFETFPRYASTAT